MKRANLLSLLLIFLINACQPVKEIPDPAEIKAQIVKAENDFNDMAQKEGIPKAFLFFAAEDAVINRGNKLYKGKSAIQEYFDQLPPSETSLTWEPEFVDVAISGDLAYTYGPYNYMSINAAGDTIQSTGVFHTVWKKQADGSWKFVWD